MSEEGEKIVSENDKTAASLRSPEIVCDEAVHGEVGLQFLDAVLGIGAASVGVVHHFRWQG